MHVVCVPYNSSTSTNAHAYAYIRTNTRTASKQTATYSHIHQCVELCDCRFYDDIHHSEYRCSCAFFFCNIRVYFTHEIFAWCASIDRNGRKEAWLVSIFLINIIIIFVVVVVFQIKKNTHTHGEKDIKDKNYPKN